MSTTLKFGVTKSTAITYQRFKYNTLVFAFFIGFFAKTAMLLFKWFFGDY